MIFIRGYIDLCQFFQNLTKQNTTQGVYQNSLRNPREELFYTTPHIIHLTNRKAYLSHRRIQSTFLTVNFILNN